MTDTTTLAEDANESPKQGDEEEVSWPLAFKLVRPTLSSGQQPLKDVGFGSHRPVKKIWWSHRLYRGPDNEPVQIQYSRTKEDSETLAQQFLNEPVVGFDMEWPWNDWKRPDLQNKIGLIQVASLDKIALFHIGMHPGKTVDEIIAPSLRKLIESPEIGKLGVGVLNADFARLQRYFRLKPRGAVELSHLYRLTKFGTRNPELVSTKLVSLANIVEAQLGHPLYKGDVRTSNWSKPLSRDQINYAAGDAYAGFMLYHCMNYKRLQMTPIPPMPVYAEQYLSHKLSGVIPLRLNASGEDGTMITSETFFGVTMTDCAKSSKSKGQDSKSEPKPAKIPKELSDAVSQALYKELVLRRSSLAEKAGLPVYKIMASSVLVALALKRPSNSEQLLAIKGIGKIGQEKYGHEWLEVISQLSGSENATEISKPSDGIEHVITQPPSTPKHTSRRRRVQASASSDSSPAFESPVERKAQLHTGLSFTMAETKLGISGTAADDDGASCCSNDSLPSLIFGIPSSRTPPLKRKRTESPLRDVHATPHELQDVTEAHKGLLDPRAMTPKLTSTQIELEPFTPRSKIARNKLLAFSKLVTRKIAQRPMNAPPIVSERTLSLIVVRAPQTVEELERIPGIDSFMLACHQTNMDLLKNVVKFVPVRS